MSGGNLSGVYNFYTMLFFSTLFRMSQASVNTEASMKKQILRIHSVFSHVYSYYYDFSFFLCSSQKICIRILLRPLLKSPFSEALKG